MTSSLQKLSAALAAVAHHHELDELSLNHETMAALALPDGLCVTVRGRAAAGAGAGAGAWLIAELDRLHDSNFSDCAEALLFLNGRWLDAGGASFALHPLSDKVLVVLPIQEFQFEPVLFLHVLAQFIAQCRVWNDKLLRGNTDLGLERELIAELDFHGVPQDCKAMKDSPESGLDRANQNSHDA